MTNAAHVDLPTQPLRFGAAGRFELRFAEYRLLIDGQPAALGGRAMDLLIALATRPLQLLSKDTLLDLVWPGVVVEDNNLRVQINNLRRLLGDDVITTLPGRGYRFSAVVQVGPGPSTSSAASPAEAAAATPPPSAPIGAPAPTAEHQPAPERLFGRAADLAELEGLLVDGAPGACITLAGSSGVGKSSLARLAMARWSARAVWVDLAPLTQGAQVAGAVARTLGMQLDDSAAAPQLQRALQQGGALLLVLDNAEHLIDAVAELVAQLRDIGPLRLLVTSQLPLAVAGERVQRLEPLLLPLAAAAGAAAGAAAVDPVGALQLGDDALALLVDRITAADRRFRVTPAALPLLSALCAQLDGLPLALEMAAARVPLMGLQAVHDNLAQRFALLTRGRRDAPARHRTLYDALDWSYRLLGTAEQQLFQALGVFAGGFTLDLALASAAESEGGRWDVVDGLAALVDRSLVSVSTDDPPRYRLLETMRAYALEQLAAPAGDASASETAPPRGHALRARHAAAVLALFERQPSHALCLAEMENVRDAFAWARAHDVPLAVRLSTLVVEVTMFSVWRLEATAWAQSLTPVMQQPDQASAIAPGLQAAWWSTLARTLNLQEDPSALVAARNAMALWRGLQQPLEHQTAAAQWVRSIPTPGPELDAACAELKQVTATLDSTPRDRLRMQGALARAATVRNDLAAELACREAELLLAQEMGWRQMVQSVEGNVCWSLCRLGRAAEAAVRMRQLLLWLDADGGDANGNLPWALNSLIRALTETGELAEAQALAPRAITAGRRFGTYAAWPTLVTLAVVQQRFQAAAQLVGYLRRVGGSTLDDAIKAQFADALAAAVAALGAAQVDALVMRGGVVDDKAAEVLAAGGD